MGESRQILRWQDWSGRGWEHAESRSTAEGFAVESVLSAEDAGMPYALRYRLVCDSEWRVREAEVRRVGARASLLLHSDGQGRWSDGAGRALRELNGCQDVDISATPLTNTLPINRLRLREGQAAVVRVAYIRCPELTVSSAEQSYMRLAPNRYRFESDGGRFRCDIEVDEAGFVTIYPGLFRRAKDA
jgi:hypothetical protein